ncbi:GNAT family N-acetyltransferase [Campylobacter hyointestinalis]|uniref:GNAT family N-acetyltransferase n=1 Tax=Campylobacter hyointestinalis TaxID=198 RepID=UPI000DCB1F8B|nr:GNAT family N-acetyltransferase [Campylobacter hyointestinalis]RAZ45354.1 GNAT family N-acetyltransferase [Campylobacter hyointestinalis subsp. lawsonii]TWO19331.1 GNAT family N-acetyltransferase [Campylobacter hyointestinalis]
MEEKYRLIETNADLKWDEFVQNSPNGTLFSHSLYLKSSNANYKLFYCYKNEELRAALALVVDNDAKNIILDDLIIYNGIMYNKPTNKQNHAQQLSEQFAISEFIFTKLTEMYSNIELSLHTTIVDIRPILWVNYNSNLPKYSTDIRYTSYVDISDFRTASNIDDINTYNKASASRRQQIRYAINKGYRTDIIGDIDLFVNFYKKTIQRQGIEVDEEKIIRIKNLSSTLINNNMAKIYGSYNEYGEIGSLALFGWDKKRAYYIFGANDPSKREGHSGTNVLWSAFYDLSNIGLNEVDMEGINSPYRGWFKLSFGGNITPYYEIHYCN